MGLLDTLAKFAANTPAGLVTSAVSTVLDHVLPESQADKDAAQAARDAAAMKIMELQAQGTFEQRADLQTQSAQIAVNQADAAQGGTHFRDGAGWICVAAMAFNVLKTPIEWASILAGHPLTLPTIDLSLTQTMLAGLLGLGSMHVLERVKGAA